MIDPSEDGSFPRGAPSGVFRFDATIEGDPAVDLLIEHRDSDHKDEPWTRLYTLPIRASGHYSVPLRGIKERLRFRQSIGTPEIGHVHLVIEEPDWRKGPAGEENQEDEGREAEGEEE